jgi:hypothetical protein
LAEWHGMYQTLAIYTPQKFCMIVLHSFIEGKNGWDDEEEEDGRQILDDLEEKKKYWNLKEKVLDGTLWTVWFGKY